MNLKLEPAQIGFNSFGWQCYDKDQGIDYDWTGDGWRSCGSKIGTGETIQDAIGDYLDLIDADENVKFNWT